MRGRGLVVVAVAWAATAVLTSCGAATSPARAGYAGASLDSCWDGPRPSPLPGSTPPPAPIPTFQGQPITLTLGGHAVDERLVAFRVKAIRQSYELHAKYRTAGSSPQVSEEDLDRWAVVGLVADYVLLCEARRDGVTYDAAEAETSAQKQMQAYEGALKSSPPPQPLPGGLSASAYFLSPAYVSALERAAVRNAERQKVVSTHPELPPSRSLGAWMTSVLPRYSIAITGLGDFSIGVVYEARLAAGQ